MRSSILAGFLLLLPGLALGQASNDREPRSVQLRPLIGMARGYTARVNITSKSGGRSSELRYSSRAGGRKSVGAEITLPLSFTVGLSTAVTYSPGTASADTEPGFGSSENSLSFLRADLTYRPVRRLPLQLARTSVDNGAAIAVQGYFVVLRLDIPPQGSSCR
jgi:hypothetical protein